MRRMFVLSRRQRGQSMTELALAVALLVLMIFGTVDFARIWNIQQELDNAARTGARYSALPAAGSETLPTTAAVTTVVTNLLTNAGLSSGVTLTLNQAAVLNYGVVAATGSRLDLTYSYSLVTPGLAQIVPSVTISGHATMRNETN